MIRINVKRQSRLPLLIKRMERNAARVTQETAHEAREHARQIVRVRTGYLKSTINVVVLGPTEYELVALAPYAAFLEYGTSRTPPYPFLGPAIARQNPAFFTRLARLLFAA